MPRRTSTIDPSPQLSYPPSARDGLTLSQVFPLLRRAWAWILIPTLLVAVGAGVFVQVVAPRYTAEAKILLESRDPSFARTTTERGEPAQPIDEQAVASQVQVVMSRDLAREAVRRLNLVGNPEFDTTVGEAGLVRSLLMMAGLGRSSLDAKPEDRVLETYFERLLVYPAGKSRILQVEFRAGDPELAAKAANTISELYIASLEAAKVDTARYASTWLGTNIDGLRARVAEAEAKVDAYRVKHGLIGSGAAGSSLGGQQLGELSSQLSQARTVKADLSGRVKILKEMIKEGRAFEIPDVANNDLIRRTVESRMTLRAQLALELRTLLPAHPRIKELTAQVDDLDKQIKAAAERIVRTLENDAKIASARVDSLQATVQGQSDVVAKDNSSEIQLRAMEREAKVQREQLESYLSRYREASARDAESATPADARIVSRAMVPELPSFPKKVPVVGFSTALAFMLSVAAILGRHLLATPEPLDRRDGADRSEPVPSARMEPLAERIDYPEPLPPEQPPLREPPHFAPAHFAPAYAGFETMVTANATLPRLVADSGSSRMPATADATPKAEPGPLAHEDDRFALQALIDRLGTVAGQGGRCVLVVETTDHAAGTDGLAAGLVRVLAAQAPTLRVDVSGKATDRGAPGLTDLVAGEAAFLDVIHPVAGSRHHVIGAGLADRAVLLDEPHGLAIGLNAMAQAYDWVICRLAITGEPSDDLLTALSACMDSVVIASDAEPDDSGLVALYALATEAGAGQVLVARDPAAEPEMQLRLSA
ncbi:MULTISPECIES: GumC family protein [Methylobacterium]|uniref:Polysaccharide chain length determinant N-terminal domain-containing protein n=1 Tax=Methylobacterium thuringiense TaxID=1003091 RepID=A0ABQ4TI84_9HYPH|nr:MULTISPECIES: GumC family protein [Methylobacterium]TXN21240.1 lipopolysaccharide biosynthesis protein [Methylobacterium sp. WL9]GJE53899.1 hypothetical protein EKPJFOCH_0367 [Methylobacterium thuringiense]